MKRKFLKYLTVLGALPAFFFFFLSCAEETGSTTGPKSTTGPNVAEPHASADSIVTDGITWYFDSTVISGRFANGDYWVKGPVTINRITPDFNGEQHGWEVNPMTSGPIGFDSRLQGFDASVVPELPYVAQPGQSLVKSVSREPFSEGDLRPCLEEAAVLTVIDTIPENIENFFRPPYVGEDKPFYSIDSIRTELLPSLPAVTGAPALDSIESLFRRVRMDHRPYKNSTYMRPAKHLGYYASTNATQINVAVLRLMLDDPLSEKMDALTAVLQCGIDYYHFTLEGQDWPRGGGEQPGNKLPIVFFATMLGNAEAQQYAKELILYDDVHTYYGRDSIALWGNVGWARGYPREEPYWKALAFGNGDRTVADPYGYIDGGVVPGEFYQHCCTSLPFKGVSLSLMLMPSMLEIWYPQSLIEYADRWVEFGTWTQPDPCAPPEKNWDNYGVTFGPDPDNPGDCIRDTDSSDGIGRFPHKHGTSANEGAYGSNFVDEMWEAYRHSSDIPSKW